MSHADLMYMTDIANRHPCAFLVNLMASHEAIMCMWISSYL